MTGDDTRDAERWYDSLHPVRMRFESPEYLALDRYTRALSVALGYRDLYTRVHSDRVLALAEETGLRAGLSAHDLAVLRIGAAFHDVGKLGIPDNILLKPGQLDEIESEEMRKHSELGANIILATELQEAEEVARVIRHHHECYDGTGYPDRLAGKAIPVCSRIIGIADSYDAMALTRAYRSARPHHEIIEILRAETGKKHDPDLMRIFLEVVERSEFRSVAG